MIMRRSLLCSALLLTGCGVSESDFQRLMRQEGIANATNTGYQVLGCKSSDDFNTGFTGAKNGTPVSGLICGSFGAGYTIRYK